MGSGWALGCTALKSVLHVHLVAGLVRSYLKEMILLKGEGYRTQASAPSENAGDKYTPVITFFCVSQRSQLIPPRKKVKEAGNCELQLSLIGWCDFAVRPGWEYTTYLYVKEVVISRRCNEMGGSTSWCLVVGSSGV